MPARSRRRKATSPPVPASSELKNSTRPALPEARRHHHDSRADEILEIVRRLGEATPYELSGELFPHIRDFSIMLGVSEVVGHLDLLEDEGRLVRSETAPHRYAPA